MVENLETIISEHAQILPGKTQEVTAQGEQFTISPFKFPQYALAIKSVTKILGILNLQERFGEIAQGIMQEKGEEAEVNLTELLSGLLSFEVITEILNQAPDEIISLLMIATNKPRKWFDELETDEGLELTGALLGVNLNFFITKIVPALLNAASRVKAGLSQPLTITPANSQTPPTA